MSGVAIGVTEGAGGTLAPFFLFASPLLGFCSRGAVLGCLGLDVVRDFFGGGLGGVAPKNPCLNSVCHSVYSCRSA